MKRIFLILMILVFFASPGYSGQEGPGHYHSTDITKGQAEETANRVVSQLISRGKLDKSWSSVTPYSASKKEFKAGLEWVVHFINREIPDESKKNLYVFLTLNGKVLAANFTGR